MSTMTIPLPPNLRGRAPSLRTLHHVERVLRDAVDRDEGPLAVEDIRSRVGRGVALFAVSACIEELARLNLVGVDPKRGAMWILSEDPRLWADRGFVRL